RGALAPAPSAPAVIGHDAAGQHRPIGLQPLAHDLQAEVIEASERGQVRGSEGSVRHVEVFPVGSVRTPIIGRPRPLSHERRADAHARLYTATPTPWIRKSPPHATSPGDNTPRIMQTTGADSHTGPGDQNPEPSELRRR